MAHWVVPGMEVLPEIAAGRKTRCSYREIQQGAGTMTIKTKWIDILYRAATGSRRDPNGFTPEYRQTDQHRRPVFRSLSHPVFADAQAIAGGGKLRRYPYWCLSI